MKTLAVLSQKGGVGKSTLAAHIGVEAESCGKRTLLIDCDPQASLAAWYKSRRARTPLLAEANAHDLPAIIDAAKREALDLAVIDTRPSAESDVKVAAKVADLVLIPLRPSILDLRAIAETVDLVRTIGTPAAFILNCAPVGRGNFETPMTAETVKAISVYRLPIVKTVIHVRTAFSGAMIDGRTASEMEPRGKAADEVRKTWSDLRGSLWPEQR